MRVTRRPVTDLCLARPKFPVVVIDKNGLRLTVTGLRWTGRACYCICEELEWELKASHVRSIEEF